MEQYEVMKEDAILGPFNIDEISAFVRSGLILKRDYAYDIAHPDSFKTVDFFLKKLNISTSQNGVHFQIFSQNKISSCQGSS